MGLLLAGAAVCQNQAAALAAKAKSDFEKVDSEPIPVVADALSCAQSSAAAIPAVKPDERYLLYYRKGYCELFGALTSGDSESFQAAARDFTEATANWPKKATARPPDGLRALISIAHLEQGRMADSYHDTARELAAMIAEPACASSPVMSTAFCNALMNTARTWLAWLAYQKGDFPEAAKALEPLAPGPWSLWISGRLAQQQNRMDEATALFEKTLAAVAAADKSPNPEVVTLLGPKLDAGSIEFQLALADYSRQRYDTAITHLDATIKASPTNSYAIFLRARSKAALHLDVPAMDDYSLAARTARASNDAAWNVGLASYYRAMLLYQAKDYGRAESEFSNALTGRLGDIKTEDVTAWKALAGVAARGCQSPLDALEAASKAASSQFPKDQASAMVLDCRMKQASTLEQYVALYKEYASRLDAAQSKALRAKIANLYADRGVAAEDHKDPNAAVDAYRHAIEWDPGNGKAHFNLGAIYIEDKHYDLAEAEFQALVQADENDYEAQYWMAESILAQRPPPDRAAKACGLLQRSLAVQDPNKRAAFAKARATAKCPN